MNNSVRCDSPKGHRKINAIAEIFNSQKCFSSYLSDQLAILDMNCGIDFSEVL